MAPASKSSYTCQALSAKSELNNKKNKEEQTYPLEMSDYIEIYCKENDVWLAATVLDIYTNDRMLVCYDDGKYDTIDIDTIQLRHISKQPPINDLIFTHNEITYRIPKGRCSVVKSTNTLYDAPGLRHLISAAKLYSLALAASVYDDGEEEQSEQRVSPKNNFF